MGRNRCVAGREYGSCPGISRFRRAAAHGWRRGTGGCTELLRRPRARVGDDRGVRRLQRYDCASVPGRRRGDADRVLRMLRGRGAIERASPARRQPDRGAGRQVHRRHADAGALAVRAPVRDVDGRDRGYASGVPGRDARGRIDQLPRIHVQLRDQRMDRRSASSEQARRRSREVCRGWTLSRSHRAEPDGPAIRRDPHRAIAGPHRLGCAAGPSFARGIHSISGQWWRRHAVQ